MARIDGPSGGAIRRPLIDTPAAPKQAPVAKQSAVKTRDAFTPSQAQGANAITNKVSGGAGELPAEVPTGNRDYYKLRQADFVRRNPGVPPPDYYMGYGDKYCQKFSNLTSKDLSPAGLKWRDATLKNLQNAIEKKRAEDPAGFAQLERDPAAFKSFCYGTHPDAYIQGGLFKLPAQDLLHIAGTPELRDLIGKDGIKQCLDVVSKMRPQDVGAIGLATLKDLARQLGGLHLPHLSLPHIPLPHLPFGL